MFNNLLRVYNYHAICVTTQVWSGVRPFHAFLFIYRLLPKLGKIEQRQLRQPYINQLCLYHISSFRYLTIKYLFK